jgi:MFS family permease
MVATLPGRTQGLGLFTEPLLWSLRLDRESYGFLNLWATLLGGLLCLPCGWLLDRLGTRSVLTGVTVLLGLVVIGLSRVQGDWRETLALPAWLGGTGGLAYLVPVDLFLLLFLTRGLGQSALSVASLLLIGRSAARRTGLTMGVYALLTSLGFVAAFALLREIMKTPAYALPALAASTAGLIVTPHDGVLLAASSVVSVQLHAADWRPILAGIGVAVIGAGLLSGLLVRNRFLEADPARAAHRDLEEAKASSTLGQALRSPAFWTFSLGTSFYGLVSSGISLFNQSILAERGFSKELFLSITVAGIPFGLASNLLTGWLATRWSLARLLAAAMGLLSLTLLSFPYVQDETQVYAYAIALAIAGGAITVCFFTAWRRGFGPAHLGQIQGAAQMLTVLFSAVGSLIFASTFTRLHSYLPLFYVLAGCSLVLAAAAWLAGLPQRA